MKQNNIKYKYSVKHVMRGHKVNTYQQSALYLGTEAQRLTTRHKGTKLKALKTMYLWGLTLGLHL